MTKQELMDELWGVIEHPTMDLADAYDAICEILRDEAAADKKAAMATKLNGGKNGDGQTT